MAIKQLTEEQIRDWTLEQKDRWWLENVYKGDMPQLTIRSALTGFLLGGILSSTNLYIGAKTGWSLGVGITSVILAFAMFKILSRVGWAKEFTILENNAMQSIATAAGYMTAPLISSLAAYMIVTGELLPWWQIMTWNIVVSVLGVLFAFPLKRRFINDEQHPFPEGQAAGVVMDTLHTSDASLGLLKAKVLAIAAGTAAFIKFLQSGAIHALWQQTLLGFKKVWHLPENLFDLAGESSLPKLRQLDITPTIEVALVGAGGLMGVRAGAWMMIGAVLNYGILAPIFIATGDIQPNAAGNYGFPRITLWSLWPGVACMVVVSLVAFFAKPGVLVGAFRGLSRRPVGEDVLKHIEFPTWISLIGIPVVSLIIAVMAKAYFNVEIWVSLVGLPLTFVLCMVAANSTALTATTPVGATSKITQLFYGVIAPTNKTVNLATASITAEVVSNSSNLLMDIKPGYMLGGKPRQQAVGHLIGILSGALVSTFLFFLLFTGDVVPGDPESVANLQSTTFPMPSATTWKAVADLLAEGFSNLPRSVVWAVIIGALLGLALETARIASKGKLPLSPVAFGLAFVIPFTSSLCLAGGALLFWLLGAGRLSGEKAKGNLWVEHHEPICAGIIAGASLMGILDAVAAAIQR